MVQAVGRWAPRSRRVDPGARRGQPPATLYPLIGDRIPFATALIMFVKTPTKEAAMIARIRAYSAAEEPCSSHANAPSESVGRLQAPRARSRICVAKANMRNAPDRTDVNARRVQ